MTAGPTADEPASLSPAWGHLVAIGLAVAGGVLGIAGAAVQELRAGGGLALAFIGAPIIEEALKPSGVYIALARWPSIMRGQMYTALLTALAGLTFGVIESLVYVTLYVSDPPEWFTAYRFTVNPAVHAAASFLVGLGLNRAVIDWAYGRAPLPRRSRDLYLAAVVLHGAYNAAVTILGFTGALDPG